MKAAIKFLSLGILSLRCAAHISRADDFTFGADLSFLKQAEDQGKIFKDATHAAPGLKIFRDHNYNWIRLRIFVEPVGEGLPNTLAYTLAMAKDAKELGYKFLLDFHYATSWADPGKQPTPDQWKNLSHKERVQVVLEYTRDTIVAFRNAGVLPDMVQIGNEITHGMLWPDGKLPEHWGNFADYIQAGIKGVEAGCGKAKRPKIMLHLAEDGKASATKYFFDKINSYKIPYDVIGFSYYPWWHGTLDGLKANLAFAATEYGKDVIVVEAAYYWKENGETAGKLRPFPETPEGQRDFLDAVTRVVMNTPQGHGKGVFWWEPAVTGGLAARGFFDDNGKALPVLTVFDKYNKSVPKTNGP
jgi:arabinogalactan endo-1,4-beta-galactosidase